MEIFFLLPLLLCLTPFIYFSLQNFIKKQKPQQPTAEKLANHQELPLPPGRTGWPILGESLDYLSNMEGGTLEKFLSERMSKYSSKLFRTSLLGQNMAVLCGPEGNKLLFSNEKKLVKVWFSPSIDKIFPSSRNISRHDDMVELRKRIPLFLKGEALGKYVGTMDSEMKQHLATYWDCEQVQAGVMVKKFTFSLACRIFLSVDDPKKVEQLGNLIEDIEAGIFSKPIDLPGTPLNRAIKSAKAIRYEVEAIARQRKIDLSEKRASPTQDILSQMLLAIGETGPFFDIPHVASHVVALLQGGYSTINNAIIYIMKYLAELPDVYHEVLREQMKIANSKDPKELLNWEDTRKMTYSWNVARETLRLHPKGIGAFREAITDITYGGYMIPKGWKLHWMASATHKNPDCFSNPQKFDPTRFEGNGPPPYTFVPFGGGPRMCPGNEYARQVVLVFMHNVVAKFRWEKMILTETIFAVDELPIRLYPHNP